MVNIMTISYDLKNSNFNFLSGLATIYYIFKINFFLPFLTTGKCIDLRPNLSKVNPSAHTQFISSANMDMNPFC